MTPPDKYHEAFFSGLSRNRTFSETGIEFGIDTKELIGIAKDRGWIKYDPKGMAYLPILELLRREEAYSFAIRRGISLNFANKHFGYSACTLESFAKSRGLPTRTQPTMNPERMRQVVEQYLRETPLSESEKIIRSAGYRFNNFRKKPKPNKK